MSLVLPFCCTLPQLIPYRILDLLTGMVQTALAKGLVWTWNQVWMSGSQLCVTTFDILHFSLLRPGLEHERSWLRSLVNHPPAAMSTLNSSSKQGHKGSDTSITSMPANEGSSLMPRRRKKPYIFVYDLPPQYNARMLQYRVEKCVLKPGRGFSFQVPHNRGLSYFFLSLFVRGLCIWRSFDDDNKTNPEAWIYSTEVLMHEMMLQSEHRYSISL